MKRRVRILGLLLFAGSVCAADTVETLLTRDREFAKSSAARGVEAWKEFLAERVVKFDAKHVTTTREAAIRELAPGFQTPGFDFQWEPLSGEISSSGDLGFTYGTYTIKFQAPDGEWKTRQGHYLTVWRKQNDGIWKVAADVGN